MKSPEEEQEIDAALKHEVTEATEFNASHRLGRLPVLDSIELRQE